MKKAIKIHNPNKLPTIPWKELTEFQGDFKDEISDSNLNKLKESIKSNGIFVPKFVWDDNGTKYLMDGHQTKKALKSLEAEGYKIGPLPIVVIEADTEEDAAIKLLAINSRYAQIKPDNDWLKELDLDVERLMSEIHIPEIVVEDPLEGDILDDGPKDLGDLEEPQFNIMVECGDEDRQTELLIKFEEEGIKCKALIL